MAVNIRKLTKHFRYSRESYEREYLELNIVDVNRNKPIREEGPAIPVGDT